MRDEELDDVAVSMRSSPPRTCYSSPCLHPSYSRRDQPTRIVADEAVTPASLTEAARRVAANVSQH